MGLISTIGSFATNYSSMGSNLLNNIKNTIIKPQPNLSAYSEYKDSTNGKSNSDLRKRDCVFRNSDKSKHFDMDKDFCWYNSAFNGDLWKQIKPKILKIKIHQFQPYQQTFLGQVGCLTGSIKEIFKGVDETISEDSEGPVVQNMPGNNDVEFNLGGGQLAYQALKGTPILNQGGKIALNFKINEYIRNPSLLYDNNNGKKAMSQLDPFKAIQNMFIEGNWLNSYSIPLISKQYQYAYSTATYEGLKGGSGVLAEFGKTILKDKKNADKIDTENLFANIPSTPKAIQGLNARSNISTQFYLINQNSEYLVRNYIFMQNFIAGTMPVSLLWGVVRPANVYYVEIQGKRQMIWAQITVNVTEVGRYRTDQYATERINNLSKTRAKQYFNYDKMLWPQAWKLTVNITDFTPNTFNSYQHYLTNGSCLTSLEENTLDITAYSEKAKENIEREMKEAYQSTNSSEDPNAVIGL